MYLVRFSKVNEVSNEIANINGNFYRRKQTIYAVPITPLSYFLDLG